MKIDETSNKKITNRLTTINRSNYSPKEIKSLVLNKLQIDENIKSNYFQVIDATGKKRFEGGASHVAV